MSGCIEPNFGSVEREEALWLIERALGEDLPEGDITSESLLGDDDRSAGDEGQSARSDEEQAGELDFISREPGVFCGAPVVDLLFERMDSAVRVERLVEDGQPIEAGSVLLRITGSPLSLLRGERIALNFVQRLSGIASTAARWLALVDARDGSSNRRAGLPKKPVLLDTRKTTPGWRYLEKYAVRSGGATNHRMNLSDGFLLKDNHIAFLRRAGRASLTEWVQTMRSFRAGEDSFVEIEVDCKEDYVAARLAGADAILLDNFSLEDLRWAVEDNGKAERSVLLEASGGIDETTLRDIAETGVDRISVGALTHSVRSLDIGLDYRMDT